VVLAVKLRAPDRSRLPDAAFINFLGSDLHRGGGFFSVLGARHQDEQHED
jgi:hypothetical protein